MQRLKIKTSVTSARLWVLLLPLFLLCTLAFAAPSPLAMMQNIADKTLAYLQRNKAHLNGNALLIHRIVERVLVPHIDAYRMGGAVVGRRYWQTATPEQRTQFIKQLKYLVISTYAGALTSYDDDKVQFYPLRGNYAGQKSVRIRSVIVRKNGQRIPIVYNLALSHGQWKIYDFSVEGVSMVQSYRSQFAGVLAHGGLPALIQRLVIHNRGRQ